MISQRSKIAVLLACLLLGGCASTKDPAQEFAHESAAQLYHDAEMQLVKGNYDSAVRRYEALDALYPFSQYSEQALLDSIYAYYQSGDYALTVATAARFIHTYPTDPHVDYAYYMKGVAEMLEDRSWAQRYLPLDVATRDPGMASHAYGTFFTLVQQFPTSPYAPYARQRMIYLRNMFASGELSIAQYYLVRHAYVASANRASDIVQHYASTPSVEPALSIMVQSYRALGQTAEANKALQMLELNFPHSPFLRTLKRA